MNSDTADLVFSIANAIAIIGGVLAVFGTAGIFFVGNIREGHASARQAELSARTAEAQRGAATANERAAALNRESDELRLELERERTERLRLEQRLSPRRMSAQLKDDIRSLVQPDTDTRIDFRVAMNNAEGDRFINEIGEAFLAAGWPRDRLGGGTHAGANFPVGITVAVNPAEASGTALRTPARGLVAALLAAGHAADNPLLADPDVAVGSVVVAAGLKRDV